MSAVTIEPPIPIFTDTDGAPLENGYIFIGVANLNPQTNPLATFFDPALTIPAVQPIRTLNGFPVFLGTPTKFYVDNVDYSIQVLNKSGSLVFSAASGVAGGFSVAQGGTGQTSYTNGQLLIGNTTGNTLSKATLTAGTGIAITNGNGSILIASTAVTSVSGTGTASGLTLSGTVTTSGNLTLSGTATVDSLTTASGLAPSFSARAFVNFNGTGTVAIRASGNVSSITDNGVGDYTVNFATAMVDANYSTTTAVGFFGASSAVRIVAINTALAGSVRLSCIVTTSVPDDRESINAAIFR